MSFSYRVKNQLKILHAHYHVIQTSLWHELMTIKEKKKKLQGLKIAWIGDGNNVCNSLIYGCSKSGINISIATPKGFEPDRQVIKKSKMNIEIETITNPEIAIKNADVVMTDTFTSIHNIDTKREKKFLPKFQVNTSLMKKAENRLHTQKALLVSLLGI